MTSHERVRRVRGLALLLAAAAVAGCDVTNPGPVQDEFLNDPAAHQGLVNGAGRKLVQTANSVFQRGGITAREIVPGRAAGAGPNELRDEDTNDHWATAHEARFIAEEAIRRFEARNDVLPQVLAQAYVWAGFANRILGENMCDAVFDGGPAEPNMKYFERAEGHFAKAIGLATGNLKTAAHAGRAQVRVWRNNWAGAVEDARLIPDGFSYNLVTDAKEPAVQNAIWWDNAGVPYKSFSIWGTFQSTYFEETGDPRTPWTSDPKVPWSEGALPGIGQVPWQKGLKYTNGSSPYRLAGGPDMRLIEAEALLVQGQWQAAMTLINTLRGKYVSKKTGAPMEPWSASSLEDAWKYLKRERGIELWLEGRRLGDLRRWEDAKTPGALDWPNLEEISPIYQAPRSRCFPISRTEKDANHNI